ncbi:hypothetical protein PC129_g10923 [Phytophthora cactorum]|uniref:WRKY transcription factor 19 n=1 Tax=Phytophthora cactorum TaxID=29920 RepID=A0A8T1D063_9STRA|nr:hypothetical protein Pcac1_g2013 [Phytophthora cactorum]KAG2923562.1 hypothetical protein PC114_g4754 [Phytophthora cactorum]KAG2932278.1 hypothetical protein PC117_g13216 [Phytophthora cactorum]KAG3218259.1 hypothetical protein PC129_g10923 [Phytophthora cactorum]KAG4235555.1 hypothetical protein PC116_g16317 [Phytophthora cactorum]
MDLQNQEKCLENVGSVSNGIESAFTTMVQRWLVKGKNGEWQLAMSKPQAKIARRVYASRKRQPTQVTKQVNNVRVRDEHVDEVSAHHIHNKFTKEFLERSKLRLAGLRPKTLKTTRSDPSVAQQHQKAVANPVRNDERPLSKCKKKSEHEVEEENHDRVECASSTQAESDKKAQERIRVLNDKVSPLAKTSGKRAAPPPTPRAVKKSKMPRSQVNNSKTQSKPGSGNFSDAKKESPLISVRTVSAQASNEKNAKDCKITLEQTADGIPVLCNGQRKCKQEGCYKAAYQRGFYCPAHGGHATEEGKNSSSSQDFCQSGMTGGGIKTENAKQPSQAAGHDNSLSCVTAETSFFSTSSSRSTTKTRPNLQTAKKVLKPTASDAWHLSDLPNLFRNASCKRTEKSVVGVKQGFTSPAALEEKPKITKPPRSTGLRGGKANAALCTVRGCKQKVTSERFCQTHYKCKRCRIDGCRNLATSGVRDLCSSHGGRSKCQVDGCVKNAHYRGYCNSHGGRKICQVEGCTKTVGRWGLCSAHGGKRLCHREGCNKCSQLRGLCARHLQDQAGEQLQSRGRDRARVKKEACEDY